MAACRHFTLALLLLACGYAISFEDDFGPIVEMVEEAEESKPISKQRNENFSQLCGVLSTD